MPAYCHPPAPRASPKMVPAQLLLPLGHIVTAKYWQQVEENKLHMSVSDSGWAKFGWGKIYGQWVCGAVIFCYDHGGQVQPRHLLEHLEKYKVTTFCAPPAMFRFTSSWSMNRNMVGGAQKVVTLYFSRCSSRWRGLNFASMS